MAIWDLLGQLNVVLGILSSLGLVYLIYLQRFVLHTRRFMLVTSLGLLVFTGIAPLTAVVAPDSVHIVHGLAALMVIFGLYDPVHNDLRKNEWAELLVENPARLRHQATWMVPMDDEILTLFHTTDLVLTPAIIAYNLDRSREEVNRRLSELDDCGLVDRIERGKYQITDEGVRYLDGAEEWTCTRREKAGVGDPARGNDTEPRATP